MKDVFLVYDRCCFYEIVILISVQIKGVILSTMGCMFFVLTQEASAL